MALFVDLAKLVCVFLTFLLIVKPEDFRQSVTMRGVQCNVSEKYFYKNYSCWAKSYSRNISTTNIIATARMPLDKLRVSFNEQMILFRTPLGFQGIKQKYFQANFRLFYKYGTIYRQVLNCSNIDVCALVEEETTNVLLWQLQALVRDNAPGLLHSCPYYVSPRSHQILKLSSKLISSRGST